MKSFQEWKNLNEEDMDTEMKSSLNLNRLSGASGLFGSKTRRTDSSVVTRLVSAIKSEMNANPDMDAAQLFDAFMEAMPTAWSIATGKETANVGRTYGSGGLQQMKRDLGV